MKGFKSHFVFNRSQQNGIFLLVLIIIILQLLYFFWPFSTETSEDNSNQEVVERLQRSVDSLKQVAIAKDSVQMAPFNPNYITDYKGYVLGMSVEEIDRLHAHRTQELWINSSEDFQEVTKVSDSLLNHISPYFKFPEWVQNSRKEEVSKKAFSAPLVKADLNKASAEELQQINGIGEKLSARIVNYREALDGFRGNTQLQDVYGLSSEVIEKVLQRLEVKGNSLEKRDLNDITLLELAELPYFDYEQARAVIELRKKKERIATFEELEQINNFPIEKLDRIKLYLKID